MRAARLTAAWCGDRGGVDVDWAQDVDVDRVEKRVGTESRMSEGQSTAEEDCV